MKFLKRSDRPHPTVSLVLLDWSVRESFHLLHYLAKQTVERDSFEVIMIEYYSRISDTLKFQEQVDTWLVLEMSEECYYHKHLMYNAGIIMARGEIVMIGDSDAMVRETFIQTIIEKFECDPDIVYHMDQFRSARRDFYPFNYPTFEEVTGDGCINNAGGKTTGVLNTEDPLHTRNYGACMCARREDLIAIGGADMHVDYLGHICGPYDMTFRLINLGRREVWDMNEFMYHTWHPGQGGADNYLGPHDGRHMSTTAIEALTSGRVMPLKENDCIRMLRTGEGLEFDQVVDKLIEPESEEEWNIELIEEKGSHARWSEYKRPMGVYRGFRLIAEVDRVLARPVTDREAIAAGQQIKPPPFDGPDLEAAQRQIDAAARLRNRFVTWLAGFYAFGYQVVRQLYHRAAAVPGPLPRAVKMPLAAVAALAFVFQPGRARERLRFHRDEARLAASELAELGIALGNLSRWGDLGTQWGRPILLHEHRRSLVFVRLLAALGYLHAVEPRYVTPDSVVLELADLEHCGQRTVLVTGEFYARNHGVVAASAAAKHLVVI